MRYLAIVATLLTSLALTDLPVGASDKHDEWIQQLKQVHPTCPRGERVERDELLGRLIKNPTNAPSPSFFKALSRGDLKFYYTRNNTFIHNQWGSVTVDIYPFMGSVQVRFWNHSLDKDGARQCGVVQLNADYVVDATWLNLDSDPESEFLCISRTGGMGAYYYSVIVDPSGDAFTFRTFYSHGRPQVDPKNKLIGLGRPKDPRATTGSMEFEYTYYVWDKGLRVPRIAGSAQ